jgi:hypothetical protein
MEDQTEEGEEGKKFLFCKKHQAKGTKVLKQFGPEGLKSSGKTIESERERKRVEKVQRRVKEIKDKVKHQSKRKRAIKEVFANDKRQQIQTLPDKSKKNLTQVSNESADPKSNDLTEDMEETTIEDTKEATHDFVDFRLLPLETQLALIQRVAHKIKITEDISELGGRFLECSISQDPIKQKHK